MFKTYIVKTLLLIIFKSNSIETFFLMDINMNPITITLAKKS